jgi:hypothetical protein
LGIELAEAIETFSAWNVMKNYYSVSRMKPGNTAACIHHNTGRLMSVNTRRWKEVILDLLEIGVTDTAALNSNEYFIGADRGSWDHAHFNLALACIHCGPHLSWNLERVRTQVASCPRLQ